jgi:hypothetical protein
LAERTATTDKKTLEEMSIHTSASIEINTTNLIELSTPPRSWTGSTVQALISVYETLGWIVKILMVCLVADPEVQRELDYLIGDKHIVLRGPIKVITCGLWMYCKALQRVVLPFFIVS